MYSTLISASELRVLIDRGTPPLLFDASFDLADPSAGALQYQQEHVPGALYAHLDHDLSAQADDLPASGGRHPLPSRERLAQWLSAQGLENGRQVVVYDRNSCAFAGRLWWMLQWVGHGAVAVLDGGLTAWKAAGGALESGTAQPSVAPSAFRLESSLRSWVDVAQVLAALGQPAQTLVDARMPARYRGEFEPLDPVAGHIPGALNRPFTDNFGTDGCFKPAAVLRAEWEALLAGRDPASVVHHCGSGVTANPNMLAMEWAGLGKTTLFAGSWSEWCSDASRPVAHGAV